MRIALPFPLIAALALTAGCGGEPDAPRAAVERDSAGIHIVENTAPAWKEGAGWRVPDTVLTEVGADADHPERDFAQVVSAYRLSDGRLAVMDAGNQQIRFFDSTGAWLGSAGRKGSGPGEFQNPFAFWRRDGDTLMVFDFSSRRVSILDDTGGFVRAYTIRSPGNLMFPMPAGAFGDGTMLAAVQTIDTTTKSGGPYRTPTAYVTYLGSGELHDTIGVFPGIEMYPATISFNGRDFPSPAPVPLGRNTYVATRGGWMYVAPNEAWEVRVLDTAGTLHFLARRDIQAVPLSADDITRARSEAIARLENGANNIPAPMMEQLRKRVETAPYPDNLPSYSGMLVDTEGNLWVEGARAPGVTRRTYSVLDSTGHWQGDVSMPDGFRPTDIGTEYVTGIWQDEDDLQYVRVYRLVRTP